jgi:hypothetical protein
MTNPDLDARQMAHRILYNAIEQIDAIISTGSMEDGDTALLAVLTQWVPFEYIARLSTMQDDGPLGR